MKDPLYTYWFATANRTKEFSNRWGEFMRTWISTTRMDYRQDDRPPRLKQPPKCRECDLPALIRVEDRWLCRQHYKKPQG